MTKRIAVVSVAVGLMLVLWVVLGVRLFFVSGAPALPASTHELGGTVLLRQAMIDLESVVGCGGYSGYDDVSPGASVVVKGGNGDILAVGQVGKGTLVDAPDASEFELMDHNCLLAIEVDGIPNAPFYQVEIGHRGALTYMREELDANEWKLDLVIGDEG